MARRVDSLSILNRKKQSNQSLLDEVGVIVVNGNFDLYGKILFCNKLIL